jgi:hypothetical protein
MFNFVKASFYQKDVLYYENDRIYTYFGIVCGRIQDGL